MYSWRWPGSCCISWARLTLCGSGGYYAVGGEALALLLPVLYYVAAVMVRDIIKDGGEDI